MSAREEKTGRGITSLLHRQCVKLAIAINDDQFRASHAGYGFMYSVLPEQFIVFACRRLNIASFAYSSKDMGK